MEANEENLDEVNQNSRDAVIQSVKEVIKFGNVIALQKLLKSNEENIFMEIIEPAIASGKLEIVSTVLDFYSKQIFNDSSLNKMEFFEQILSLHVDPDEKWFILQAILYYTFPQHRPLMYRIMDIFYLILSSCLRQKQLLKKFFNIYYKEEHNSLFPLMKRLEKAVDGSRFISVLLHDDIYLFRIMSFVHTDSISKMKFYVARHVKRIFETFVKLLRKNTKESMELAVETFKELIKKDFYSYVVNTYNTNHFGDLTVTLNDPLTKKLCFQFLYYLQEGDWQSEVYTLILYFLDCCPSNLKIFYEIAEITLPFVQKISFLDKEDPEDADQSEAEENDQDDDEWSDIEDEDWNDTDEEEEIVQDYGQVQSLLEICRDAIRSIVAKNVDDMKSFMDEIWAFNVPQTVKCNLLYIPDASWMNDL
ncbi:uncharacterized protein LOC134829251 isoform X2 [Culicoides brevitarsis]|uniref:uncharacterized protein LOC134829251 isoform X2 n=1 Tax=Culicoides brevitarsis TaxID=469753 RepID=UPI00307C8D94